MKGLSIVALVASAGLLLAGWSQVNTADPTEAVKAAPTASPTTGDLEQCLATDAELEAIGDEDGCAPKATCFNCSKSSTGACAYKGQRVQCRGSRSGCRNKGCKITGTSSCSSAGNVKKC